MDRRQQEVQVESHTQPPRSCAPHVPCSGEPCPPVVPGQRDWREDSSALSRDCIDGSRALPGRLRSTPTRMARRASCRRSEPDLHVGQTSRPRSHRVRFGRGATEDEKSGQREGQVRIAYNSPFWPFVLASTSVGQEGLDFHQYSHAIVHWSLPSNPVDLEQREGRVHRYKGHAVRKNVAAVYGSRPELLVGDDPWEAAFNLAAQDRPAGESEVFPYWIFPLADGAHIERYVPTLPLSKETHKYKRLMRTVGAYRLVVGQPRQEDLLKYLGDRIGDLADLRIDLSP